MLISETIVSLRAAIESLKSAITKLNTPLYEELMQLGNEPADASLDQFLYQLNQTREALASQKSRLCDLLIWQTESAYVVVADGDLPHRQVWLHRLSKELPRAIRVQAPKDIREYSLQVASTKSGTIDLVNNKSGERIQLLIDGLEWSDVDGHISFTAFSSLKNAQLQEEQMRSRLAQEFIQQYRRSAP